MMKNAHRLDFEDIDQAQGKLKYIILNKCDYMY